MGSDKIVDGKTICRAKSNRGNRENLRQSQCLQPHGVPSARKTLVLPSIGGAQPVLRPSHCLQTKGVPHSWITLVPSSMGGAQLWLSEIHRRKNQRTTSLPTGESGRIREGTTLSLLTGTRSKTREGREREGQGRGGRNKS